MRLSGDLTSDEREAGLMEWRERVAKRRLEVGAICDALRDHYEEESQALARQEYLGRRLAA